MAIERLSQASILTLNKYSSMNAGAVSDYQLLSSTTLGGSQASITFTSDATWANFKHLQIRGVARTDVASIYVDSRIRFNGDSGANYSTHEMYGAGGSAPTSGGAASQNQLNIFYSAGSTAATYIFAPFTIDILDAFSTTKNKTARSLSGVVASSNLIDLRSGAWYSTSAITSININLASGNFIAGSRFSLYGLKG